MKEAIVTSSDNVEIVDSPIPKPGRDQVVIKVLVSGSNPKDWKSPAWMGKAHNSGDDVAGIIHSVGEDVYEFKAGDRVAAFHEMRAPHGSFAEYSLAWQHTTFHIPESVSFEEAATIPLAAMTSAVGLYLRMGLPEPWLVKPVKEGEEVAKTPLIVYGAASAVGAFAIQLAQLSNLHPIIGIAGRGIPFAESLIDKSRGDTIIDYRSGDEAVVSGIRDALKSAGISSGKVSYAFDAVSENGSHENIAQVLAPNGHVTCVLPWEKFAKTKDPFGTAENPQASLTMVGCVHAESKEFGFVWFRYLARMMAEGRFKAHPQTVVPGGLAGVSEGLKNLEGGKASATKYVFRVPETEGAGKD